MSIRAARTIEMRYLTGQRESGNYPWQFVINGRTAWVKGANWCYPDPLFRLDRARQNRFLHMARTAHVQLVRVWGGGPVENDDFYDLCDELGIMVQQEFAMHGQMQYGSISTSVAADTAAHQVMRLRNRPSLVAWPIADGSVFEHHTPTFDIWHVNTMIQYARDFLEPASLPDLIKGMQLSQGMGLKFMVESMRGRKPASTATYIYKLTENYPACSWATIDYYGYPKQAHYMVADAFRPLHVMATFDIWNASGGQIPVKFYVVNDTDTAVSCTLTAKLYDGSFNQVASNNYAVNAVTDLARFVATRYYSISTYAPKPMFLYLTLTGPDGEIDRNWYPLEFTGVKGSLYTRATTTLTAEIVDENGDLSAVVTNTGAVPAVSVEFGFGSDGDIYYMEKSGLWLAPGEQKSLRIFRTPAAGGRIGGAATMTVSAWNAASVAVGVPDNGVYSVGGVLSAGRVGTVLNLPDGRWVSLKSIVSAGSTAFADSVIYVQNADRVNGIQVNCPPGLSFSEGQSVLVEGYLTTQEGRRVVVATRVTPM